MAHEQSDVPPLLTLQGAMRHVARASGTVRAVRRFDVAECLLLEGARVRARALDCLKALEVQEGGGNGGDATTQEAVASLRAAAEHIDRTAMEFALLYRACMRYVSVARIGEVREGARLPSNTGLLDDHAFVRPTPMPSGKSSGCGVAAETDACPVLAPESLLHSGVVRPQKRSRPSRAKHGDGSAKATAQLPR